MRYSTEPKFRKYVKGYGFLSFARKFGDKYGKKLIDTATKTGIAANGEEITGSFYEKELQKTNQTEFRIVKIRKKKGDKLYVKWKGYDNSFNSWINNKDIV